MASRAKIAVVCALVLLGVSGAIASRSLSQIQVQAPTPKPIRIFVEYQGLEDVPMRARVTEAVEVSVKIIKRLLKVNYPTKSRLLLKPVCPGATDESNIDGCPNVTPDFTVSNVNDSRSVCGLAFMNPNHLVNYTVNVPGQAQRKFMGGVGEAADFYLYVTSKPDASCGKYLDSTQDLAFTKHCLYYNSDDDPSLPPINRPAMANLNLCPGVLNDAVPRDLRVETVVRELIHALGFDVQFLDKWVDSAGQPRTDHFRLVQDNLGGSGRQIVHITSQRLLKMAQNHFGCSVTSVVDHIPFENQLATQNAWEMRWLNTDIMSGNQPATSDGSVVRISPFTLAFLEDSGWYTADVTKSIPLTWGKGQGCDFLRDCSKYVTANPTNDFFCSSAALKNSEVCAPGFATQAQCAKNVVSDGCAVYNSISEYGVGTKTCQTPLDAIVSQIGATSSAAARCANVELPFSLGNGTGMYNSTITVSLNTKDDSYSDLKSLCFEPVCKSGAQLFFNVLGKEIRCPSGQVINLNKVYPEQYLEGQIVCPNNLALCTTTTCPNGCNGNGDCVNGVCVCRLMYSGPDCNTPVEDGKDIIPDIFIPPTDLPLNASVCIFLDNTYDEFISSQYSFRYRLAELFNVSMAKTQKLTALLTPTGAIGATKIGVDVTLPTSGLKVCYQMGMFSTAERERAVSAGLDTGAQQQFRSNLLLDGIKVNGSLLIGDEYTVVDVINFSPPPVWYPGMFKGTPPAPDSAASLLAGLWMLMSVIAGLFLL